MTGRSRNLQAADGETLDVQSVVQALGRRFSVATGGPQVVRRTRLDTFDRRLHAAGLSLEHDSADGSDVLVLDRPGGGSATVPVVGVRWPALAHTLPAGPLRDQVAEVSKIRALTVVAEEKRRVRRVALRNGDGKTVVRLELDEPTGDAPARPATVTVRELLGYAGQAGRAVGLLTGLGLRPVTDGDVAPTGERTAAAGVDRDAPALELLAPALSGFLWTVNHNLAGLLADVDTEFLHDVRVAVRRSRSTLKLGRPALPDDMHRWEPELKWLGDLTTPVRDLDVYELALPTMAGWLVAADPADLGPFATHLRRRRTAQRRALLRGLKSARFERLLSEWGEATAALPGATPESGAQPVSAGDLAGRAVSRAARRVLRGGAGVTAESPAQDLHALRKRCKELRYALEVFAPVLEKTARRRAVADLKGLQNVLGRFQDTEVQGLALRGFAEEMMADGTSAEAMLAMGELIGHLDSEQHRARQEFDASFSRFARPATSRRLRELGTTR